MSLSKRQEFLQTLTDDEAAVLLSDWRFWAREDQTLPEGDWINWLVLAGRGWGKTRVGAEAVLEQVAAGRASRIALVAETAADARDVMVEGPSGILTCSPPWDRPLYEPSKRRITWRGGAVAITYNATEPNQLRGPQHDLAWCDEVAKWRYLEETWDNLQFGLRIGDHPRQIVTTTPRPLALLTELLEDPNTHSTRGRTLDNAQNLAGSFLRKIISKYRGTRLGRQELDAEILDDMLGALWTRAMLEKARRDNHGQLIMEPPDGLETIVVAIDPSGTSGDDDANDVGIVVAGRRGDRAYILEDLTCSRSPAGWGRVAVSAFHNWGADRIVAERNYGGAMVEHVIRTTDRNVSYREVHASRGKVIRAEPVSALYEQNRVKHVGTFPELEDQMCMIGDDGYAGRGSPDRLDAAVWAVTDLMLREQSSTTTSSVRGLH